MAYISAVALLVVGSSFIRSFVCSLAAWLVVNVRLFCDLLHLVKFLSLFVLCSIRFGLDSNSPLCCIVWVV